MNKINELAMDRAVWWIRYNERSNRLLRLLELNAPRTVLNDEIKMIQEARNMCIRLSEREEMRV